MAQFLGAIAATLLLRALIGKQGSAGLTLPGAQQIGPLAAIGVGSYLALAGLWESPVARTGWPRG